MQRLYLLLFSLFIFLPQITFAQEKIIELSEGIHSTSLFPDGKIIKIWRDNGNAHGFYFEMFITKNNLIALDNGKKISEYIIEDDQNECSLQSSRLTKKDENVYLIHALKETKTSYCDSGKVSFSIYKLQKNDGTKSITPFYFLLDKIQHTTSNYKRAADSFVELKL